MSSILIKLPNWMGDILFSYDLLFTLSMKFDRVALLTSPAHAELFGIFPIPRSTVIAHENWPNLDRDAVKEIERFQPDLGLLLTNSFGSALALSLAGVPRLFGYATEHRKFLLKEAIPAPGRRLHQVEYYLELLKLFGVRPVLYPLDVKEVKDLVVVIHPGASKRERAWSPDRFLKLAESLKEKGAGVKFVTGEPIHGVDAVVRPPLHELAHILRNSALFVGNDSGPLHLAQQCGSAVVGIYGPGDPLITGPRPITPSRVVYHGYPCSPCRQRFFTECSPAPSGKPYCIETISTAEVVKAAFDLLGV
jgi:heptosyltransferase-2